MKVFIALLTLSAVCFGRMVFPYQALQPAVIRDTISWNDFDLFIEGFMEGMNMYENFTNIRQCAQGVPKIVNETIEVISCIRSGEIVKLAGYITRLFMDLMQYGRPCANAVSDLGKILRKLWEVGIQKIVDRFMANIFEMVAGLANSVLHLVKGKFKAAGVDLGGLAFILIFGDSSKIPQF